MISLQNVSKVYSKAGREFAAIRNINLDISKGDFVTIFGKSGCGKSTLLNIIGTLTSPTQGSYLFNGKDITHLSRNEQALFRNQHVGFVLQNSALIPEITALHNIIIPLKLTMPRKSQRKHVAEEVMEWLQIYEKRNSFPNELSGGEQQRVAIARAIVTNPSVILADEPTGALDVATGFQVFELLQKLNEKGTTVILVTHDMEMASQGKSRYEMRDGKIVSADIS